MKGEIKEILELFGSADENIMFGDIVELNSKQSHLLLDYITNLQTIEQQYSAILSENAELENKITNLQQENKQLKEDIKELFKENENKEKVIILQDNIIKKAIECINYYAIEDDDFNKLYDVEEQELLTILGDKENE